MRIFFFKRQEEDQQACGSASGCFFIPMKLPVADLLQCEGEQGDKAKADQH